MFGPKNCKTHTCVSVCVYTYIYITTCNTWGSTSSERVKKTHTSCQEYHKPLDMVYRIDQHRKAWPQQKISFFHREILMF